MKKLKSGKISKKDYDEKIKEFDPEDLQSDDADAKMWKSKYINLKYNNYITLIQNK